tara:strand:- start:1273 stop:2727 length:1455 start_codon:yes stop_codon:yes gene_type:complete
MESKILNGDCIQHMKEMEENSVDAIITDPPYGLEFMGKEWDKFKEGERKSFVGGGGDVTEKTNDAYMRINKTANRPSALSMQQKLCMQLFFQEWATECLRVLKPGGFLLSFGGTRTYHRLTCGIEDAGFEIRDTIMWLYGSGFPKSLNIGKQVDKLQKNEREVVGTKNHAKKDFKDNLYAQDPANRNNEKVFGYGKETLTKGNSEWEGWGTALKPACEPIVVARKPLSEKNVALNVLKWGTGGINIDGCRIGTEVLKEHKSGNIPNDRGEWGLKEGYVISERQGRFPANIILDEEAGEMLDLQSGETKSPSGGIRKAGSEFGQGSGWNDHLNKDTIRIGHSDKGGASRFFYCAKASKGERNLGCEELEDGRKKVAVIQTKGIANDGEWKDGKQLSSVMKNNHPTVKPIKLMEYLIKLVSREGAVILDPFLGSGTTAIACIKLNRLWIGIEKEPEYIEIAKARINHFSQQRKLECVKTRLNENEK